MRVRFAIRRAITEAEHCNDAPRRTQASLIAECGALHSHSHIVGPAISYALGQGATMISAAWGVFVWREFASAPPASRRLIPLMFALFLAGLAAIAVAPLF
jgi:hypothetical protein